jgi:hypothetical protein
MPSGGLLQLVAYGATDIYLTGGTARSNYCSNTRASLMYHFTGRPDGMPTAEDVQTTDDMPAILAHVPDHQRPIAPKPWDDAANPAPAGGTVLAGGIASFRVGRGANKCVAILEAALAERARARDLSAQPAPVVLAGGVTSTRVGGAASKCSATLESALDALDALVQARCQVAAV